MKSRNWTFLHYKEHGNQKELYEYLNSANLMFAISPCHKHDIDDNGKCLKPHYHVVLQFSGPVTDKSVIEEIVKPLGDPVYIQKVKSIHGIDLYLCHENALNKVPYDRSKILYSPNWSIPSDDKDYIKLLQDLVTIIDKEKVVTFNKLIQILIEQNNRELIEFCINRCYLVDKYINSRYINDRGYRKVDK